MAPPRERIDRFDGDYRFLSNFAPSPVKYGPYEFGTVEQAYQFAKLPKDKISDEVVAKFQAATPAKAKAFGRALSQKNGLFRPDWEEIKEKVMRYLLEQKFAIPELREQLLRTGRVELVEGNVHHDNEWGDCLCTTVRPDERKFGQKQACHMRGRNKLGRLLMLLRAEFQAIHPYRCPTCGNPDRIAMLDMIPVHVPGRFVGDRFEVTAAAVPQWDQQSTPVPPHYWCLDCQAEFVLVPGV